MKKIKFSLLMLALIMGVAHMQAQSAYAVLNGTTLTFYYDSSSGSKTGTVYTLNSGSSAPKWYSDGNYANVTSVVFNSSFANAAPTTCYSWFYKMTKLASITGINYLKTSNVTNMKNMFYNCSALKSITLTNFNTTKVTDMSYMFNGCSGLTSLNLSSFNTAAVTNFKCMFQKCTGLTSVDVSKFNTAKATDMSYMFSTCSALTELNVSSLNISSTSVSTKYMLSAGNQLKSLTINATAANLDAEACKAVGSGSSPCALNYPQGFTPEKTSSTSTYYMWKSGYFKDGTITGGGGGSDDEEKAYAVFSGSTLTFYYDDKYGSRSGSVYDLNTGSNAPGWYANRTSVKTVTFDASFKEYQPETTYQWFYGMSNLTTINNMDNLDTESVTNMAQMFRGCSTLSSVDVSKWDVSSVNTFSRMFQDCKNLVNINTEEWENENVTNLEYMFSGCTKLKSVSFCNEEIASPGGDSYYVESNFSTANVTTMSNMFAGCTSLEDVTLAFTLKSNVNTTAMFSNCSKLQAVILNGNWKSLNASAFTGVGTATSPCILRYSYEFKQYFEPSDYGPGYFNWKGGYFTDYRHAFAVLDGTTLSFHFDSSEDYDMSGEYTVYSLNTAENNPEWRSVATTVKKVEFDESFKNARPTSTFTWFYNMTNLTSITGIQYLNTSYLTNTAGMFNGCSKLATIDMSEFDTSKVTNMRNMFKNCSSLTELDLGKFVFASTSVNTTDFMLNCSALKKLTVPITANVLASAACKGVGTSAKPCELVIPADFNLEKTESTDSYFVWKGGYFKFGYREGDMNKDGKINVVDVMILVDIILNETEE